MNGKQKTKTNPRAAGRPKGSSNAQNKTVKDMIEKALHKAEKNSNANHGIGYLTRMAEEQPSSFLTLVGKLVPQQLAIDTTITVDLAKSMQQAAERLHAANQLAIEQGEQAVTLPIIDVVEKETET